jgi:hypothetical protein
MMDLLVVTFDVGKELRKELCGEAPEIAAKKKVFVATFWDMRKAEKLRFRNLQTTRPVVSDSCHFRNNLTRETL